MNKSMDELAALFFSVLNIYIIYRINTCVLTT